MACLWVAGRRATSYALAGPKVVPRVDHNRFFVFDDDGEVLGEHPLTDGRPLQHANLRRGIH